MSALLRRVLLYLLFSSCAVAASICASPAYSVGLADAFPEKEAPSPSSNGVKTHTLHSLTLSDSPRYPDDFGHFGYVNPDAPKRGTLRTATVGTFHNLSPFMIIENSLDMASL